MPLGPPRVIGFFYGSRGPRGPGALGPRGPGALGPPGFGALWPPSTCLQRLYGKDGPNFKTLEGPKNGPANKISDINVKIPVNNLYNLYNCGEESRKRGLIPLSLFERLYTGIYQIYNVEKQKFSLKRAGKIVAGVFFGYTRFNDLVTNPGSPQKNADMTVTFLQFSEVAFIVATRQLRRQSLMILSFAYFTTICK